MMNGYSTMGAVALRIISDYGPTQSDGVVSDHARYYTKYSLNQLLEKVCVRHKSVATFADDVPSYIWWKLGIDEWSEITPIIDLGALTHSTIRFADPISTRSQFKFRHRSSRPRSRMEEPDGAWGVALNESISPYSERPITPLGIMLKYGLSFGQDVLTRCVSRRYTTTTCDGVEEEDAWEAEIIYADAARVIDIPLDFPNFAAPAEFKGWRIA